MARKKKAAVSLDEAADEYGEQPAHDAGANTPTDDPRVPEQQGPMDEEEFRAIIQRVYSDGASFVDTELSWQRAEATDYYLGKEFGNEEDGRSAVVLPVGRAVVTGLLPGMLAMLFAPDRVCEFIPTSPQTVAEAEQATEAVHTVFMEECDGFQQTLSVLKDGLIRRLGVFKWWWDDTSTETHFRVEHCTPEEIQAIAGEPGVTITRHESEDDPENAPQQPPPQPGQPPAPPVQLATIEFKVAHKDGRPRVAAIPPDEFLFSREGRSVGDNTREMLFCGHRRELTTGELLALGVKQEDIDEHGGNDTNQITQVERVARAAVQNYNGTREQLAGEANMKHIYVEGYIHVDFDGDGVAELRRVCSLGPTFWPIPYMNTPADERPFACFTPDPEPHELLGLSMHDKTEMAGRVMSMVFRATLDNLSGVVSPRLGYVEGEVSPGDALNQANGAPLRMKSANSAAFLETPFVGDKALSILGFLDDFIERQTGQTKGVKQVDADALQSSTPEAVDKAVQSGEAQQQLITRIFAEYTFKRVIRGLYGLIVKHQPRARMMKMRGKWVEVDPAKWPATMGMRVNVAIGTANTQAKLMVLEKLYEQQTAVATQYGADNPIYPLQKISATAEKILRLNGIEDVDTYMNVLPPDFKMPPQPPPPPTPEEIQAKAMADQEQAKSLRELSMKKDELALKEKELDQKYDLELRKLAADFTLRRYQIDAQFKASYTEADLEADAKAAALFLSGKQADVKASLDAAVAAHGAGMAEKGHALDTIALAHQREMDLKDQAQEDATPAEATSEGA